MEVTLAQNGNFYNVNFSQKCQTAITFEQSVLLSWNQHTWVSFSMVFHLIPIMAMLLLPSAIVCYGYNGHNSQKLPYGHYGHGPWQLQHGHYGYPVKELYKTNSAVLVSAQYVNPIKSCSILKVKELPPSEIKKLECSFGIRQSWGTKWEHVEYLVLTLLYLSIALLWYCLDIPSSSTLWLRMAFSVKNEIFSPNVELGVQFVEASRFDSCACFVNWGKKSRVFNLNLFRNFP